MKGSPEAQNLTGWKPILHWLFGVTSHAREESILSSVTTLPAFGGTNLPSFGHTS
jgi:hypothetical protein